MTFQLFTDPSLRSFQRFGLKRKLGIGPKAIFKYLKVLASGHRQGWTQGDPLQQGGVVIVDQSLNAVWTHINDGPGDHVDLDELVSNVSKLVNSDG